MLQPLPSPGPLSPEAHFYDPFHRTLYYLQEGALRAHLQAHNQQQNIPLHLSAPSSQPLSYPALLTVSGEVVSNAYGNIVAASSEEAKVRSNVAVTANSHWEWHVPLSLSNISLGICKMKDDQIQSEELIQFNSSTARTVTFYLKQNELNVWVNGTRPGKKSIRTIDYDHTTQKIYPFAKIKERGSTLIFIPFLTTSISDVSSYNPFGALYLQEPKASIQFNEILPKEAKITKLIGLSADRMLLVWDNNRIQVISRDKNSRQFIIPKTYVQNNQVFGLFSEEEYNIVKQWRGERSLFKLTHSISLLSAFQWLRFLISQLDNEKSQRKDLYRLLLAKLLAIRPYLYQVGVNIPNLSVHSSSDIARYSSALPFFQGYRNIKKNLLNLPESIVDKDIQGEIKCITSNYLLSLKQKTVIVYFIGDCIKQIFRENLKHFIFNKRSLVDSYDQSDLRYIQKDGSYLYKILTSSLNAKKKQEEAYVANPKDVQQLVTIFKIEEKAAITALEHTGNIQEALVWICTQKKDQNSQKDCLKEQGDETQHDLDILQFNSKFTRLLLSVNRTLYILGVTPKQIHRLIERGENEFIDLISLKHENSIDDMNFQQWYKGTNHPQLHLLDSIQLNQKPELLAKSNNKAYFIFTVDGTRYKQEIVLSIDSLFELKESISLKEAETPLSLQLQKTGLIRSVQGELICPQLDDYFYQPNTTVLIGQQLFSNSSFPGSAGVRLTVKIAPELLRQPVEGKSHILPLTIENGPPGVNKNYSIANILTSNGSFLGNYPQGLRLRHLHNLVINLSSLKLRRCTHRKNINYIEQGVIYFKDIWGLTSQQYSFKFQPNQQQITIIFEEGQYWKEMFLEPKFTTLKKLPYQIGSFTAEGKCLSQDVYLKLYQQRLSILLNSHSSQRVFIHNATPVDKSVIELDVSSPNLEYLESFSIQSEQVSILGKTGVTFPKKAASFQQIQSLPPAQIMKYMSKHYTQLQTFLRYLSTSHFFSLDNFQQRFVRQFVDLVIFSQEKPGRQQYYQSMFAKIWQNNHGRQYLLALLSGICQSPVFPRQYISLLLPHLPQKYHEQILKSALEAVNKIRSKQYTKLGSDSPYLYYQTEFYSDYYFNLADPIKKSQKQSIFSQQLIKSDIAVFKSDFTRRIILKLPAIYMITDFTLRIERCDTTTKVHYTIFSLNTNGKKAIGSGFIQEHQWSQIAQLPYKQDLQKAYDLQCETLNVIGLQVQKIAAQYIEIELRFTETGIIGHQSQTSRIAQVDILPELYGHEVQKASPLPAVEQMLGFNPEDMFFLSVSKLLNNPMKKYSISKGKGLQFLYYTPQKEDIGALQALLQEKIEKSELQAISNIQRKLIANNIFSHQLNLDYLYTLIALTLGQLQKSNVKVEDTICQKIYSTIVEVAQGPIKLIGFKAISHKIHLLIKSLQYIERELQSLGEISFSYEQLVETADFSNPELCKSLTRLILRGVPYEQKWAELLIRMSTRTEAHQELIGYFIDQQDWLKNQQILDYISSLPDQIYVNSFLTPLSYSNLSKLVLTPSAKPRLDMLLEAVVQRASNDNPVDLDVISLIFQQDEVRWEQLQTVIGSCPQATDTVIHQFLQSDIPQILARQNSLLFYTASSPKYAEEFAVFLEKIYQNNRKALVELMLSLNDACTTLHYDALETIGKMLTDLCFLGGVEGVRLVGNEALSNLQAVVSMLKLIQKLPEGAELPNEDLFIDWYLRNNDYQLTAANPAHKTPAYYLMKQLIDQVLTLIKTSEPSKVLTKYMAALKNLKSSKRISPIKRHLMFNQLHHGASTLLTHTLRPGSLANVFASGQTPLLISIINDLKTSGLKRGSKYGKWIPSKEVDISDNFQAKNVAEAKDLQVGKGGSKMPAIKIPISQKNIKLASETDHFPTKFTIGFCLNDHADNKNAILPSRVQLFAGNQKTLLKIGDMNLIEDQFYLSYGVTVFAINLNSAYSQGLHSINNVEFKFYDPLLCSASEVLEGGQKTKKGATYNVSFISIHSYDSQPTDEPDYSLMYVTLLGFLGQHKYRKDLREVIKMPQFDQKLQLIIQVLNDLLPNDEIEQLLLSLNQEGENILQYVLKSKGANPKLVNSLILGKLTKDNVNKLIQHTLNNISDEFVNIVTLSSRLASYSLSSRLAADTVSDFENIKLLLEKYEHTKKDQKDLYQRLINSIMTVPNLYNYDISKFINFIWGKPHRHRFYPLLAAVLPYYPTQLDNCSTKKYVIEVVEELESILLDNQKANSVTTDAIFHIQLICTLSLNSSCRQQLLQRKDPIKIMELIKSSESILVKYNNETMRLFISFFQNTCIGTSCQDEFSQILINVMTSLNQFNPVHHNYFIHSFFFPLINAFKGVPVLFVWKHNNQYLKQITDILQTHPIRSNSSVILFKGQFYHPIQSIDKQNLASNLLFVEKETEKKCYLLKKGALIEIDTKKQRKYEFKDGKVVIEIPEAENITLVSEKFKVYEQNEWQKHLLTNSTLLSLNNPWVFTEKYHGVLPIKDSTSQRCYFLPQEMEVGELLKQINICGFRIHPQDLPQIKIKNYLTGQDLTQKESLRAIISGQKEPYLKIAIQATEVFKSSTIESLSKQQVILQPFVAQETIFKAFQQKKGLQKMITVLKGCVKNWASSQQSNIWGQYLKELESYSCFPVFSSLYINKQSNVALLFDLLLGLPDKQDAKKWLQKQKQSVKQLYMIIKDVFSVKGQQALVVREYAMKSGFYSTMLERLYMITKQPKRFKVAEDKIEEDVFLPALQKKPSEDDFKSRLQKRQGVGYGTDSSSNQKWDVTGQEEARKEKSQQILSLLTILQQFFDCESFKYPPQILNQTYESALLPIIESSLRGGSLLEISKFAELFKGQLSFIQVLAKRSQLVTVLMPIPKFYEPRQSQSLYSLLKTLASTSKIFLACLTGSASQKTSEEIAKKIIATYELVEEAISQYETAHYNQDDEERKIMELPLPKKYPLLMKDLRFDYIDMKDSSNKITKHHYASNYQPGHKPPVDKTIRLAQELADLSHALPIDHTNAIYVRCDKERVDFMQALIMGSNGTPYGHGAYLFDIYFEDSYPNGPPKVNLMTTGSGQIRFNPNLYACGKVCLSLLGTWRGNAMENWDSKVSTLLQVLVSIQSIIMSEDIYFNEPGFQHEAGTTEGQKKNQAYANIVRYGNVKFAMLQNIKNPPKGFESVIRRHFFLKKDEILQECQRWLKLAQKRQASYNGLVSDHNYNWCNNFKKSKTEYKTMLEKAVKELEEELRKLPPPTHQDFKKQNNSPTKAKKKGQKPLAEESIEPVLEEIDVSYGGTKQYEELDINDEKVKDRWSRYIGAMGVEAVTKQSKASIVLLGLGAVGVETAKNIVLSGCKELAIWDDKIVKYSDLSGQFFLSQSDVGNSRLESSFFKLQELNHYVKMTKFDYHPDDLTNFTNYQLVIATQRSHEQLAKLNTYCHSNKIHFISVDCYGPYGQIFNDFGDNFEVLDKDGEEPTEVLVEDISIGQKGVVKLVKGYRHPYEDGDTVRIAGVKGMKSLSKQGQSINGTLHKIKVIDPNSFEIENTTDYTHYEGEGTVKNMKTVKKITFKTLEEVSKEPNIESNLEYYDWSKSGKLRLLHTLFLALSDFTKQQLRLPLSWNKEDATNLTQLVHKHKAELSEQEIKYIKLFSYTCSGTFGSICAFFGGIAAQEAFKAITGKYTPINQFFLAEFSEIIESPPDDQEGWNNYVSSRLPVEDRTEGLRRIVGADLITKLQNCKLFMVGSGAIGCELLKNFAMIELGAGSGTITVTDPDHIETSNLNRQFLFREKHLRKPKSATATAAVIQMNPRLKGHIKAKLDKVCEATRDIFSNEFFEGLDIVANALDNVQARRYVDTRCVESKVALLQSGTLSSKGHVQVIIPYKTQTYGNMQDPNDAQGDIPHCTLKMFPEQTLHCVEWARDLFGKEFTLGPKALRKLLDAGEDYAVGPSDIQMLRECIRLIKNRPHNFEDAIETATKVFYQLYRNDIMQLLYTYPLEAKTKDGKPFWKLPKRPPTPIEQIDPNDPLHNSFLASYAVLIAKIYGIPFPKDFRSHQRRQQIAETARKIKVEPFVPSDKAAKEMAQEVNKQSIGKEEVEQVEQIKEGQESQQILYSNFKEIVQEIKQEGETVESKPEEFQKDDDQNGHIDLISSMANLRARNYKLEEMEWITVKLKAGRIMPALSTTTSCIAALQTIELVKYLRGCTLQQMRNSFLNLAIPSLTMGEPGPVEKIKVHENLQTNIWQRWSVGPLSKNDNIGQFIKAIQIKYGVIVKGLTLAEGSQIYSDFVMSLESKKEEREKLLKKTLEKLVSEEIGDQPCKFIDFTLVMGVGETLIKHAPTLRLLLQN